MLESNHSNPSCYPFLFFIVLNLLIPKASQTNILFSSKKGSSFTKRGLLALPSSHDWYHWIGHNNSGYCGHNHHEDESFLEQVLRTAAYMLDVENGMKDNDVWRFY